MDRSIGNPILKTAYFAIASCRKVSLLLDRKAQAGKWVPLYYHAVTAAGREAFEWQIASIADRAVRTTDIGVASRSDLKPSVAITFDDGFACIIENALPALVKYNVPATIFVVTGAPGHKPGWRMDPRNADAAERMMTFEELRSLPADLITIGSHTVTHRKLGELPAAEIEREVSDSRRALEDCLGRQVKALAFPHGSYGDDAIKIAFEAGYEQLFTIDACVHPGPLSMGLIGRFATSPQESRFAFKLKCDGAYDWLAALRRMKRTVCGAGGR